MVSSGDGHIAEYHDKYIYTTDGHQDKEP
jgi:hypothetical protein